MTAHRDLKRIIRERQSKTGESYSAARVHVMRERATLHGLWVTRLRNLIAGQPPLVALIEQMILRKRSSFGHDLRLIGEFKILEKDGEWGLRAEARAPTAP
jgi:hypothetical protein